MKKSCTLAVVLTVAALTLIWVSGCKKQTTAVGSGSESGKIVSAEPTSFKEVTSKLDPGGSFYMYLSTEQALQNLSGKIGTWRDAVSSMPDMQDQQQAITNGFNIVTRLVKDSGIEDISGVGMSSIAREPGFYFNKMVVHHYSGQGNGFIWTMFGKEAHELAGLDLLPTNTAMAAFYDFDVAQGWSVIQKECEQSGFPQARQFLKDFPQQFEQGAGMKWDEVLGSLGGEFGMVVTLNEDRMVTIPVPGQGTMDIPEPAIMLVAKVKNDAIFNHIDEALQKTRQRIIRVDKGGLKMRTIPVPLPLPITLRPTLATSDGYLFVATSDAVIQEALGVKGGKAGLKSTAEFKKLSTGVPLEGNEFCFLSQRFGQAMMKLQQQAFEMNSQMPPQLKQLMQSLIKPDKAGYMFGVGGNTDEGWIAVGNGNQGGGSVLAAGAAVPVGLLAAIAVPNFIKARDVAQRNTCINNLRIIDGAKQMWALENNKTTGAVPSWSDLKPYLGKNAAKLKCPVGGEYIIGAVGEKPRCSIAGHELPQS